MSMDKGKKMQQTGSRFKAQSGSGDSTHDANQAKYHLQLKDNLGGNSPEYKSSDINKTKTGIVSQGPSKISKYASNIDLKPTQVQGFSTNMGPVPITTANSQIINDQ